MPANETQLSALFMGQLHIHLDADHIVEMNINQKMPLSKVM